MLVRFAARYRGRLRAKSGRPGADDPGLGRVREGCAAEHRREYQELHET